MTARLLLIVLLGSLAACTHPIEIVGEGDILSASGDRDCLREQSPCEVVVINEYIETYTAVARPGSEFVGWEGCTSGNNVCSFDVTADIVHDNWFTTAPPLIASFGTACVGAPPNTFTSIQQVIFNGKGCANAGCHNGNNPAGGMNLSSGSSYASTVGRKAASSALNRIAPGNANDSYLFRKVSARTNPGSFTISGSPMPLTGSALSQSQLTALALWIDAGAPQFGRASATNEVEELLGQCN